MKLLFPTVVLALSLLAVATVACCVVFRMVAEREPLSAEAPPSSRFLLLWLGLLPVVFHVLAYLGLFIFRSWGSPGLSFSEFLYGLKQWDAVHYLTIAGEGYTAIGPAQRLIVFLPLYPALIALTAFVTRLSLEYSALLLNILLTPWLSWGMYKLARLDHSEKISRLSVLFLFLCPMLFIQLAAYAENLYLPLLVFSLYFVRKHEWGKAGVLVFLTGMTRTTGYFLFPALCWEYFIWARARKFRVGLSFFTLFATPLALGIYLSINRYVYGDPFRYLYYYKVNWYKSFAPFWKGLFIVLNEPTKTDLHALCTSRLAESVAAVGGILLVLAISRRQRLSYVLFSLFSVLYFLSTGWVLSTPRYLASVIPFYFWLADTVSTRVFAQAAVAMAFIVGYFALFYWFSTGYWAF